MKFTLMGRKFQDTEDIQRIVTTTLKAVPQQQFQKKFPTVASSIVGLSA
jgi:hypothetical protein